MYLSEFISKLDLFNNKYPNLTITGIESIGDPNHVNIHCKDEYENEIKLKVQCRE